MKHLKRALSEIPSLKDKAEVVITAIELAIKRATALEFRSML